MIGKVPREVLDAYVIGRTGATDDRVVIGPAYGEDTGAVALDGGMLVVSTDPISLAVDRVGTLGVAVACNDVAASGAEPAWLTVVMFLHDDDPALIDTITAQLDAAASDLGVAIVSGHSEYAPSMDRPMLVLTAFGLTDRYIPTGGAEVGDVLLMTKTAATEGTAILASDFGEDLDVGADALTDGRSYYERLSVVEEAMALAPVATAMHDPTEGGLVNGLLELAVASDVALEVDASAIPVTATTRALCAAAGVDPLRIFSSGVLLAAVPEAAVDEALNRVAAAGREASVIGRVTEGGAARLELGGSTLTEPIRDEMYALWA